MLTDAELKTLNISADLWNNYLRLPIIHPDDQTEFRHHLHALQNIILARPGAKSLTYKINETETDR